VEYIVEEETIWLDAPVKPKVNYTATMNVFDFNETMLDMYIVPTNPDQFLETYNISKLNFTWEI